MGKNFKENVAEGNCGNCGKRSFESNRTLCHVCLEKMGKRRKLRYEERKKNHLCVDCGTNKDVEQGVRCSACCKKGNAQSVADRWKKKELGLCYDCGQPVEGQRSRCDFCHNRSHSACMKKREERVNSGLCVKCGRDSSMSPSVYCKKCYLKGVCVNAKMGAKQWKLLESLFDKQKGVCPYTGRLLTLGVDDSLDHVTPKSKGGDNSPCNLQWVYRPVNVMKLDLGEKEFLSIVKDICGQWFKE